MRCHLKIIFVQSYTCNRYRYRECSIGAPYLHYKKFSKPRVTQTNCVKCMRLLVLLEIIIYSYEGDLH